MKAIANNPKGFTLLEMIAAMGASLAVMVSIYTAYINHQRSHVTQQLVVEMQQNARAAMSLMKREIRMTGYDPVATDGVNNDALGGVDDETSGATMLKAEEGTISFSADVNYNGAINDLTSEEITYTLAGTQLMRQDKGGTPQVIAYDIEAVAFAYAVDNEPVADGGDGELDLTGNGFVQWYFDSNDGDDKLDQIVESVDDGVIDVNDGVGGQNWGGPQIDIDKIRAVRIWLLARTRHPIKGHTDNRNYAVGPFRKGPDYDGDWDPRPKRVLLTATVYCRNM